MKSPLTNLIVLSVFVGSAGLAGPACAAEAPKPIRVLLITGGCCHDYAAQKEILKQGLEARAHVVVDQLHSADTSTKPPLAIFGNPEYAKGYDVVIHDECAAAMEDPAIIRGVLAPHRKGIPGVNLHCAAHSYRIGNPREPFDAGSERGMWFEYLGIQSSGHGPKLPMAMTTVDVKHPITAGLAWREWTTGNEELYNNIQVLKTATPLHRATQAGASGKKKTEAAPNAEAVVTWVNDFQGTRVFNTTVGHFNETVGDDRYLDLVTRGLLWSCDKLNDTYLKPDVAEKNAAPAEKAETPLEPIPDRAAAAGKTAAAQPNVLFCIADDASPHFGVYGCDWVKTPHIDRVARAGLVFRNVYTPTAKCAPSRAAILTGRNPWQLEEAANHQPYFPAKFKAFTEVLRDSGVHVGAQGKTWGPGKATTADGAPRNFGMTKAGENAANPGAGFRRFLASREAGQPFFYWFGSTNPHRAYKRDAGLEAGKKPADIPHVPAFWPDNDVVRRDMLDYATEVEAFDSQVGSLLAALEESGELDNTLVIVTSDHGMPFPRVKGHNYDMANRIPLVARWPQGIAKPGRTVDDLISLVDVAPTLLELYGIDGVKSGMAAITGNSLADLLRGASSRDREFVVLGRERNDVLARPGAPSGLGYPVRGIREGNLLYLHNFAPDRWPCGNPDMGLKDTDASPTKALIEESGAQNRFWQFCYGKRPAEELFDITADPDCVTNLMESATHRSRAAALRDKLFAELRKQHDPRILGQGDVFDNYPSAKNVAAGTGGATPAAENPNAKPGKKAKKKAAIE